MKEALSNKNKTGLDDVRDSQPLQSADTDVGDSVRRACSEEKAKGTWLDNLLLVLWKAEKIRIFNYTCGSLRD